MISIKRIIWVVMVLLVSACSTGGAIQQYSADKQINASLDQLEILLKNERLDDIRQLFSNDYYGGIGETSNRLETTWHREQLDHIDFHIDRVLESDGLYIVKVSWRKSFIDASGNPQRASGVSELVLRPDRRNKYRIINITGDSFF